MSATPVDDHTEEFEELTALVSLDILEGDELTRFQQHAAHCERCQLMVRLDREALARAAPEMDPSPDFKQRVMERAAQELAATQAEPLPEIAAAEIQAPEVREPTPLRRPPNVVPFWRRSAWASALAAVLVIGLVGVGAYSYQNQVVATYALSGNLQGRVVVQVRRSGATELNMDNVQRPRAGHLYEFWIIPEGGQPIPAGVTSGSQATVQLGHLSPGTTVAITEEEHQVELPTGTPIMAGVIG